MEAHEELPLLVQTIFESLRLYPPVWVLARTPSEDITVTQEKEGKSYSWLIHQGTEIFISPLILQRQKSVWGEDAEVFKPERMKLAKGFFKLDSEIEKIFYPFVDGAYKCPGREFAKLESMLAIAGLLRNFDIKLKNQDQLPDPISGGTFRLFSKLSVKITKR
jgi:cytochrome P450